MVACKSGFDFASKATSRITIQSMTSTPDDAGGRVETWSDAFTVWAIVEPMAGKEVFPCIKSVDVAPTQITPLGLSVSASVTVTLTDFPHHDRGIDAYVAGRSYTPEKQGTFFGKLRARKAAVNRAWKRGEITQAPFIELLDAKSIRPKGRPLKPPEIASLLASASPHVQVMMMVQLGTGCRPQAAVELTWAQVDFEAGLIYLNPEGRQQTKKVRPVVRIPPSLRKFLMTIRRPAGVVVKWGNAPLKRWETGWRGARSRAGLDNQVNPYSLRHTVARWCRSRGVPKWEVENQLGHGGRSQTDTYAPHDPAYLAGACEAIEALMREVAACQSRAAA